MKRLHGRAKRAKWAKAQSQAVSPAPEQEQVSRDPEKPADCWTALFRRSAARMYQAIAMGAPSLIIRNEARMILITEAGGRWRAIARWARDEAINSLSCLWVSIKTKLPRFARRRVAIEISAAQVLAMDAMMRGAEFDEHRSGGEYR